MSAKAASTIGFERRFNPAFRFDEKARFVDYIMEDVPPKPPPSRRSWRRTAACCR